MFAQRPYTVAILLSALSVALGQQIPPESPPLTFHSQTGLVLLSFHAWRGKSYSTDLTPADVVLLEDGKPRPFTIFDGPATQGRMPLELVLLFDANPKIAYFWDPEAVFRFIPEWSEAASRSILEKHPGLRISVYRCAGKTLSRLSPATADAQQLLGAFRRVLTPDLPGPAPDPVAIPLTLPERRNKVSAGPFTNDYVTSPFISTESRGWPLEAAIGVLNDVSAPPDNVARTMVMFSEGIGATTTVPEDVGNQALDLGIPIYPVVTNYQSHIDARYPRNLFRMNQFAAVGTMTGGHSSEYQVIFARSLQDILEGIINDGLAQYVVGFVPPSGTGKPKEHTLTIKLASKSGRTLEGGKRRATY